MNGVPHLFLSYSREDAAVARRFAETLEREGFSVWWDATLRSGEAYDEVTERALAEARAVIVLWSTHSVGSRWVRAEATEAHRNGTLLPVMIEPCKRPIMFELTHTADLSGWNGDAHDPAWRSFVADVRRFAERGDSTSPRTEERPAPVPPRPPARRQQQPVIFAIVALLLVGGGLWWFFRGADETPVDRATVAAAGSQSAVGPSIAVLPFTNLSSDPEQEYFSDGLSEELLNQLARVPNLRVIGRTSSFAFKGKNQDLRGIGQALGVNHILEGSVRKSGERMRITAQLIDSSDGSRLWSDAYDRTLEDIFMIQEDIARTVAAALQVRLGGQDIGDLGTRNVEAYDAYLAGRASLSGGARPGGGPNAVQLLERAVALDPAFSSGWAALSSAYAGAAIFDPANRADWVRKNDQVLERLQGMRPATSLVIAALSARALNRGDLMEGERLLLQARELPNPVMEASLREAQFLMGVGRPREAVERLREVVRTEPIAVLPSLMLQIGYEISGELALADAEQKRIEPYVSNAGVLLGSAMVRAMARRDAAELRRLLPTVIAADSLRAPLHRAMQRSIDDPRAALAELRRQHADPATAADSFYSAALGQWAGYFGDVDLELAAIRRIPRDGGNLVNVLFTLWRPVAAGMRGTPAFKSFVRELGVVDYWRATGKWGDFCRPLGRDDFECR